MDYIDSFRSLDCFVWYKFPKKRHALKTLAIILSGFQESVDSIRSTIDWVKQRIAKLENTSQPILCERSIEEIKILKQFVDFCEFDGRLSLMLLDINTVLKYILCSKTDYEYRFFARRAYTLMYESKKGILEPTGHIIKDLGLLLEKKELDIIKREHKRLSAFWEDNKESFRTVRNDSESHKDKDFITQLNTIENIKASVSMDLIENYCAILANLGCAFNLVRNALSKKL